MNHNILGPAVTLNSFQGLTFEHPRTKMLKQVQHDMSWAS